MCFLCVVGAAGPVSAVSFIVGKAVVSDSTCLASLLSTSSPSRPCIQFREARVSVKDSSVKGLL